MVDFCLLKKQTFVNDIIICSCKNEEPNGAVLEIKLDQKFLWPQEGLDCKALEYEVVT